MNTKLSICIPTSGLFPNETIRTVKRILECKRQDIELVVVDNDSTGTRVKEKMLEISDSRFYYYQNERDIGRSNNIVKALEKTKSQFALLCSSDDVIYLDAIDKIIELIDDCSDCSVILGKVYTNKGRKAFDMEPVRIGKGIDALERAPFMGNLMPIVVNTKMLDFSELYNVNESYMQNRLVYCLGSRGDIIVVDVAFGEIDDNANQRGVFLRLGMSEEDVVKEIENADNGEDGMYFSPKSRAQQLIGYLDLIDEYYDLSLFENLRIVDKWVNHKIKQVRDYVFTCRDPAFRYGFNPKLLDSSNSFLEFCGYVEPYFRKKDNEGKYCYTGKLEDRIKNEAILLKEADDIINIISSGNPVYVYGVDEQSKRLISILSLMNVAVAGVICEQDVQNCFGLRIVSPEETINTGTILVTVDCEEHINNILKPYQLKKIYMREMYIYLTVAWCDRKDNFYQLNEYVKYIYEPI